MVSFPTLGANIRCWLVHKSLDDLMFFSQDNFSSAPMFHANAIRCGRLLLSLPSSSESSSPKCCYCCCFAAISALILWSLKKCLWQSATFPFCREWSEKEMWRTTMCLPNVGLWSNLPVRHGPSLQLVSLNWLRGGPKWVLFNDLNEFEWKPTARWNIRETIYAAPCTSFLCFLVFRLTTI